MDLKKLLVAGGASALMIASTAAPAFAASYRLSIIGNGENGNHTFSLVLNRTTNTTQTNNSTITNNIEQEGETGENRVTGNVGPVEGDGGATIVESGAVDNTLTVDNTGGTNLVADPCDCVEGEDDFVGEVTGNGEDTTTVVGAQLTTTDNETQTNATTATNGIEQEGETGENVVHSNTGLAPARISSGAVRNMMTVFNRGDWNSNGPVTP